MALVSLHLYCLPTVFPFSLQKHREGTFVLYQFSFGSALFSFTNKLCNDLSERKNNSYGKMKLISCASLISAISKVLFP